MAVSLVIGSQWGDEGKGKIIDYLSQAADYVVRFHGGNNAGHTVINEHGKFALHLIPSGVFNKKAVGIIANGTAVDLKVLLEEIETIEKAGVFLKRRLFVSPRCHLIMPYHKILDKLYENAKRNGKTGTTGRGIGPVHADKVSYNGIRIYDLQQKELFQEKLTAQLAIKNEILAAFGEKKLSQKEIEEEFFTLFKKVAPYIAETYSILAKALKKDKRILLEGAQGVFLDNDWGTYPFVTASNAVAGSIVNGAGIAPKYLKKIFGVAKAYTTRVGEGPFPTELFDANGEKLRQEGNEVGVTTGRPRRCGWLDTELIRFAAQLNGFTELIITKLDVLDSFSEIPICTGYTLNGKKVHYYDGDANFLDKVKPVYKTLKGWQTSTKGIHSFAKLPKQAKQYLKEIENQTGVNISCISTGANRDDTIKI